MADIVNDFVAWEYNGKFYCVDSIECVDALKEAERIDETGKKEAHPLIKGEFNESDIVTCCTCGQRIQ